jgi:hypothetical protein
MRAMPAWPDVPGITAEPAGASRGIAAMGRSYEEAGCSVGARHARDAGVA